MSSALGSAQKTYISQGEQAIGHDPDDVIATILGSCVAVCLWDYDARLGGMNHILLPDAPDTSIGLQSAGAGAMERLINGLLKIGADKERLHAKIFGGAAIISGLSDIGARNAAFVRGYLATEQIRCVAESLGGTAARQIRFWPESGRVRQRFVRRDDVPEIVGEKPVHGNGLELL